MVKVSWPPTVALCMLKTTLSAEQINIKLQYRSTQTYVIPLFYYSPASVCEHEQLASRAKNELPGLTCCVILAYRLRRAS